MKNDATKLRTQLGVLRVSVALLAQRAGVDTPELRVLDKSYDELRNMADIHDSGWICLLEAVFHKLPVLTPKYTFDSELVGGLYKDAYGFVPFNDFLDSWEAADNDGKQRMWDQVVTDAKFAATEEIRRLDEAEEEVERLLYRIMQEEKCSRRKAIEILRVGRGIDDMGELEGDLGVRYGYFLGEGTTL